MHALRTNERPTNPVSSKKTHGRSADSVTRAGQGHARATLRARSIFRTRSNPEKIMLACIRNSRVSLVEQSCTARNVIRARRFPKYLNYPVDTRNSKLLPLYLILIYSAHLAHKLHNYPTTAEAIGSVWSPDSFEQRVRE